MKRVARQPAEGQPQVSEALAGYTELESLLRRHLSPSTAALFARPKQTEGGIIEWYSDLDGQPVPFNQLNKADAEALQNNVQERLTSIEQLATQLQTQGEEGARQAALLRQAAAYPDLKNLYSLNGQPLVTFWGGGKPPVPPIPPAAVAGAGVAGAAALGTAAAAAAPIAAATAGRRIWPWLLALLLLAGLGAGLWWWWNQQQQPEPPVAPSIPEVKPEEPKPEVKPEEPKPEPEPVKEEEPKKEEPKAEEPKPEPEPKVEEKVPEKAPEPEPVKPVVPVKPVEVPKPAVVPPAPKPEPVKPEPPKPAPPPKPVPPPPPPPPSPIEQLEKRVQAAGNQCDNLQRLLQDPLLQRPEGKAVDIKADIQRTLASRCREQMITNAKNLCPNERPKEVAPELVIVFDASGSMDLSMLATEQEIDRALMTQGVTDFAARLILGGNPGIDTTGHLYREPKRITVAKQATTAVVQQLPSDVNAGLVLVERCDRARSVGFFSAAQRGQMLGNLQRIQPVDGTPLADGIAKAGQMVDGVNRESVILVVSDGKESCHEDPCAVARDLARRKPHLKINVVDILGTGAGNCLAQATGGRVFTARNMNELNFMTTQAARDVLPPAHCRP